MKIFTLGEGSYSVDATKKFIPFNPETDNFRERPASLFIHVNPFLIKTATDLIVLDTGLGYKDTRDELFIHQHIRNAGFDPADVTLVLMSHLHYDHSGGLVVERDGRLVPSFPQAQHVIQKGEWETAISPANHHHTIKKFLRRCRAISTSHLLKAPVYCNRALAMSFRAGIALFTRFSGSSWKAISFSFGGDELPEPEQLIRKFIAKYDFDGRKAMQLREEYGKMAAAEGWICLFYHAKSLTTGKVIYQEDHFKVEPA